MSSASARRAVAWHEASQAHGAARGVALRCREKPAASKVLLFVAKFQVTGLSVLWGNCTTRDAIDTLDLNRNQKAIAQRDMQ